MMKTVLQLEQVAMTAIALYALSFHPLGLSVWIWVLLFFTPDISMMGYLAGARIGAFSYNLFHHKGVAAAIIAAGYFLKIEVLSSTGILLVAHASFDRILGYGLKYATGLKDTHLGSLERKKAQPTLL